MHGYKYSAEETEFMFKEYPNIGLYETCRILGRTPESVMSKAKNLGIRSEVKTKLSNQTRASHSADLSYFDVIEGYSKGYVLGLIMADGSMVKTEKQNVIVIEIKACDEPALQFVKQEMNLTSNINYRKNRPMCSLCIPTRVLIDRIFELGVHPNKSKTIRIPSFIDDPEFLRGLICGYFDGDGSAYMRGKKHHLLGISFTSSSRGMLEDVSSIIHRICDVSERPVIQNKLVYFSETNAVVIMMYQPGDPFHLERKALICAPFIGLPKPKMGTKNHRED